MNKKTYDVFISRKSEDAHYAKQIYDYLTAQGLHVFESDHSLKEIGNADYSKVIEGVLEKTTHLIALSSTKEYLSSGWVEFEWKSFLNRKRSGTASGNLFTVICSNMQLDEVPFALRSFEVIPFNKKNFPIIFNYSKRTNQKPKPAPPKPLPFKEIRWFKRAVAILFSLLVVSIIITTYVLTRPYNATLFLKPKATLKISDDYPIFEKGTLSLFVNGEEITKEVLSNGEVDFSNLEYNTKNEWVKASYKGNYWKLEKDSILLEKQRNIDVVPDGSLATVFGNILDENGKAIPNAKIQIDTDTLVYSNKIGVFKIDLPVKMQKQKYLLSTSKEGYKVSRENYSPKSGRIDVLLSNE